MSVKKTLVVVVILLIIGGGLFYNHKRKMESQMLKGGLVLRDIMEHKGYCCGKSGGKERERKEDIAKRISGPEDNSLMKKINSKGEYIPEHTQTLPVTIYTIDNHAPSKYARIILELNDIAYLILI